MTGRDLSGRCAVVTGAGSGIGEAVARSLAGLGMDLCLIGSDVSKLRDAVGTLSDRSARFYGANFADDDALEALAERLGQDLTRVDLLVHSAGTIEIEPFATASIEAFDRQWRVNARAPYLLTQRLLPQLRSARGQVVFVNSSAGRSAGADTAAYAASKHALKAIADGLRAEVNADGIRVISVYPGRTATAMQRFVHGREGRDFRPATLLQPSDVADVVIAALRLPDTAEVTDIDLRPMRKTAQPAS